MKYVISFFVLFICFNSFGQKKSVYEDDLYATSEKKSFSTLDNFKIKDGSVVWQKVFKSDLSKEELETLIDQSGIFDKLNHKEDQLYGNLKQFHADFKGAGFSEMSTPIYVARNLFDGFAIIEFKEGKYRVTVKKVFLTQIYTDPISEKGEQRALDVFAVRKDKFKSGFRSKPAKIVDYTFNKMFSFSKETNDDW